MTIEGTKFLSVRTGLAILLLVAAFGLGYLIRGGDGGHGHPETVDSAAVSEETQRWTCSMHPQIILPRGDKKCPICNMDLIPIQIEGGAEFGDLTLSPRASALADITTEPVRRRFVARDIRLVGKVSADETRTRTITARVGGRLDRLFVDATGQVVTPGMKLAEIYSPELYSAQAELQTAAASLRFAETAGGSVDQARANLESAAERLRLWGMDDRQIEAVRDGKGISEHLTVTAPVGGVVVARGATQGDYVRTGTTLYTIADLTSVWVTFEAFESDVAWLREGQPVAFSARAYPGRAFAGDILFIEPFLDERTRTVEVRVAVDNAQALLKPGMLVTGTAAVTIDASGDPVTDPATAAAPLVIPASAPLLTGSRAVVYVRLPGQGDPVFSGRIVDLGPRAGDFYLVMSGLSEGELVVSRGSFKIDSALQIKAGNSMMNPAAEIEVIEEAPLAKTGLDPATVGPCFGEALDRILKAYLPLQMALAGDDEVASAAAALGVKDVVDQVGCETAGLPPSAREDWVQLNAAVAAAAAMTAAAEDIAGRRQAFEPLSDSLWKALARFGTFSGGPVRRFHCPMAFDNEGAHWIQGNPATANPYYGDMMLRCGSQKEILGETGEDS